MVGLATRVWQHARLAEATTEAVRKLTAARRRRSTVSRARHRRAPADAPTSRRFDVFWEATQERTPVEFDYRRSGADRGHAPGTCSRGASSRYSGRWYVVGLDTDRGEERIFRLSRVQGEARQDRHGRRPTTSRPAPTSAPADPPPGARRRRPSARSCWSATAPGSGAAPRRGPRRDRRARPGRATGWDRLVLEPRRRSALADELLGYGADVYVEEPGRRCARPGRRPAAAAVGGGRRVSAAARERARTRSPGC